MAEPSQRTQPQFDGFDGYSISPNGQYVVAADQGKRSVMVFEPDSPQDIKSFSVSHGGFGLERPRLLFRIRARSISTLPSRIAGARAPAAKAT